MQVKVTGGEGSSEEGCEGCIWGGVVSTPSKDTRDRPAMAQIWLYWAVEDLRIGLRLKRISNSKITSFFYFLNVYELEQIDLIRFKNYSC